MDHVAFVVDEEGFYKINILKEHNIVSIREPIELG
jgi:hypothetical protein